MTKPSIPDTLIKTDELFKRRDDINNLRQAVTLTAQLRDPDKRNYEVEWKFAKYNCFLGQRSIDDEEREKLFGAGKDAAKIASHLQPDRPEGHFWYGANLGELSKMSPITVGLTSVDDIREEMNKVIEIDPGYQGASAYDILAQVELSTRLTGGKPAKAAEYLEKALTIEKNNSNLRIHLAQAYLALKKDAPAKQQLEYVLKMRPDPDYVPEHLLNVEQAKKMLATKF